jgi:energy-coupling factor transport system ATP-binding protein
MVLAARNLEYAWDSNKTNKAVYDVTADFRGGVPHFVCGPSGSGKTTLGLLLSRLQKPDSGTVDLEGASDGHSAERAFVFQFAENLFFEDTVADEVRQIADKNAEYVHDIFAKLGIEYERIAALNPFRLSAGYARLVATGLQMARDPQVLILDEPTIGLDWRFSQRMTTALKEWINPQRILIMITHDLDLMRDFGGQAWAMTSGRLVWNGATETLLNDEALLERLALRF